MPRAAFFTIDIDDIPRVLFSVQRRTSGDLTLILKHGAHLTAQNSYNVPSLDYAIVEQRISIHCSPQTQDINVIKHTMVLKDGSRRTCGNYTMAVKRKNRFAPLLIERCRDLSDAKYIIKRPSDPQLSLGKHFPTLFQLVYAVFVGPADRHFSVYSQHDIRLLQVPFEAFRIVVIWSFIGLPSNSTGNFNMFYTTPPEEIETKEDPGLRVFLKEAAEGYDESSCLEIYRFLRERFLYQYIETLGNDAPEAKEQILPILKAMAGFFPYADPTSAEYIDHGRRLQLVFRDEDITQAGASIKSDIA